MAATSASQRPFNYGPGPSWGSTSQASARSPSSSRDVYPLYKHPYVEQGQYIHSYGMDSASPPDVRVTAPSRAGEEHEADPEWDDDRSVYSERMSASQNFYSQVFQSGMPSSHHLSAISSQSELGRDSWQRDGSARPDSNVDPFSFMKYESPRQQLPKVVVSSPSEGSFRIHSQYEDEAEAEAEAVIPHPITPPPFQPPQGRVPSAVQGTRNFSRPSRAAAPVPVPTPAAPASQSPSRSAVFGSDEQKREVLERNQRRQMLGQTSPHSLLMSPSSSSSSLHMPTSSPSRSRREDGYDAFQSNDIVNEYVAVPASRSRSSSPSRTSPQGQLPALSQSSSLSSSASSVPSPRTPKGQGPVVLPSNPPDLRVSTTESIYSMYSYYQLDNNSTTPSPSTTTHFDQSKLVQGGSGAPSAPPSHPISPSKKGKSPAFSPNPNDPPASPKTADDFLALGISHHEADRLAESAECFEKSATLDGGCAVGMLMWGLSLRHGWGTPKDEARSFKWLKRAAEHAVVDLQQGRNKPGRDAVKKELVLAVYEVGQSFFQGWGVPRDKVMGVSYFQTAAQLGDPDAQQDLAFCLANGRGCKKDRKAAAKWYRAAAAQGASTVGLAWIYKPKYAD